MRIAIVFGWGAVEETATEWDPLATVTEIDARLWRVNAADGAVLGAIAKEPWTKSGALARLRELSDTHAAAAAAECGCSSPQHSSSE
jgi:hypothetical protein